MGLRTSFVQGPENVRNRAVRSRSGGKGRAQENKSPAKLLRDGHRESSAGDVAFHNEVRASSYAC